MFKSKEQQSKGHSESTRARIFPLIQLSKAYNYDPLPKGQYIRYLVLGPGKFNDPLVCNLHAAAVTELPYLEAVSYVWGGSNKTARVLCAGQTIHITANLKYVLQQVRLADSPRTLWVDSICINQDDKKEKGHQVALMEHIYRRADATLICLGPDHGRGQDVSSLLAELDQTIEAQLEEFGSWDQLPPLNPEDRVAQDRRWRSVTNMILDPWFGRVWVVQEARLSRNARVLYGRVEFPWRRLMQVHVWLLTKAKFLWFKHHLYLNDTHFEAFWPTVTTHHRDFLKTLCRARLLGCSDPRDRVFAFLGLPSARDGLGDTLLGEPDYSENHTHFDVYHELAVKFLQKTCDLFLLCFVDHTADTFKENLPSWVPRWDRLVTFDQFGGNSQRFNACGVTGSAKFCFQTGNQIENGALKLRGFIIGSIQFRSKLLADAPEVLAKISLNFSRKTKDFWMSVWIHFPRLIQNYFSRGFFQGGRDVFIQLWEHISDTTIKSAYDDGEKLSAFLRTLKIEDQDGDHSIFDKDTAAFALSLCRKRARLNGVDFLALEEAAKGGDSAAFRSHTRAWYEFRRFILTDNGYYGLAPRITEEGDVYCVIHGLHVPVILRKMDKEHHFKLVGEAFILGIMQGQAIVNAEAWGLKEEDLIIC